MNYRNPLNPIELRSPQEYITLAKAVGLSADKANEAIYRNPLKALEHGRLCAYCSLNVDSRKSKDLMEILDETD